MKHDVNNIHQKHCKNITKLFRILWSVVNTPAKGILKDA